MKILRNYLSLFLILSGNILAKGSIILLSDLSESSEQYGFYKLELRLASTYETEKTYTLKIYKLPNKNISLADGDKVYTGTIKHLEDIQFIFYLKPVKEGSGEILYKVVLDNTTYTFSSKYEVKLSSVFDEEKNIELKKFTLKLESPKQLEKDNDNTKINDNKPTISSKAEENNLLNNVVIHKTYTPTKIILAVLAGILIIMLLYYKKKTRFFK